jgi:hypothetical protein
MVPLATVLDIAIPSSSSFDDGLKKASTSVPNNDIVDLVGLVKCEVVSSGWLWLLSKLSKLDLALRKLVWLVSTDELMMDLASALFWWLRVVVLLR